MPKYKIKTSGSEDEVEYRFSSLREAKEYFCNKILDLDYDGGDALALSSGLFEEMGALVSKYSNEKCYAIQSFAWSVADVVKWGNYKREESARTNKEIIGDEFFSNYVQGKCNQLHYKLKRSVEDTKDLYMPNFCCDKNQEQSQYKCDTDGYNQMLTNIIGCSNLEGVCEGNFDTFKSDL